MKRLTSKSGEAVNMNGDLGTAVKRLSAFEDFYEALTARQNGILADLDKLRLEGRVKTVQFRELLGKKAMNAATLSLMRDCGIE